MGTPRFRPKLEGMEDRLTPAVTEAQAVAVLDLVEASRQELGTVFQHLGAPKTELTLEYHRTYLPQVSAVNMVLAQTLADYVAGLNAAAAADPSRASTLAPYIERAAVGQQTALSNAAYSLAWGIGFGADPPQPPAPPTVPPPGPTGPSTTPLDPTDATGMSRTIPDLNSPEWRTTASGLRIWDVVTGSGEAYEAGDIATVHYVGWLTDGTIFDSSIDSGNVPLDANLGGGVIQGWIEGVPGLAPGGLRRLDIPAELAYGSTPPQNSSIPPNARLIFEIKGLTPGTDTPVP